MKKIFQNCHLVATVVLLPFILLTGYQTYAQRYPAVFDPAVIPFNGTTNGFVIQGLAQTASDNGSFKLGNEVRFIGDINNDGIEDIALGNGDKAVGTNQLSGRAFIIFGSTSAFPTPFDLTTLDGTNGFVVEGIVFNERRGSTIAGPGDINGDGIDDLIIGSSATDADEIVLYGTTTFPALITVNDINGTNGFLINTPGSNQVATLGDVNGDGIGDFIIGTPHFSGTSWIIFGRTGNYPASLDILWLDGTNGFRTSNFPSSRPSYQVGGAGDINNDGQNDILIGSWNSPTDANSYALFGKNTPFGAFVDITAVNGTDGFLIDNQGNGFITSVGPIGDINNDGIDDCFSENNIILGSATAFPGSLLMSDLNGSNGFVLENIVRYAAPTGDLNLDGVDDFIVASTDPVASNDYYVVFGRLAGFPATFDRSTLDGTNGFQITIGQLPGLDRPVDGGEDFNGDGFSDFIMGDLGGAGNSTGLVYVVFGSDFVAPTITCPGNQQLCFGTTVMPDYTSSATVTDTEDPNPVVTQSPAAGSTIASGTTSIIITLTATDASGNTSDCAFTVNLTDTEAPVMNCTPTSPITVGATIDDYTGLITSVTDNCDSNPVITQSPPPGSPFVNGITIRITATDATGNASFCEYVINIPPDTTPPTITCPGNQQLLCTDTVIPDYTGPANVMDTEDPNPAVTQSPAAGSAFTNGMTVTLTATDASGNAGNCTFIVNQEADTDAPVINCPPNQVLALGAVLPDYTSLATTTDNCDGSPAITQFPLMGTAFTNGMTVTLTATDASGNTTGCTFIIDQTTDTEAPAIVCPTDRTLVCNTTTIPDYTALATVSDNQDPNPALAQNPMAGTAFVDGMTITLTATDASGNAGNCTFIVNQEADTDAPVINCPPNQVLALGAVLPDYTSLATTTDNCDGSPAITQFPLMGTAFTNGMTIILTATDASGNTTGCTFIIDQTTDTEAPTIVCPTDQTLACNTATIPDYTALATVSDNDDPNPALAQNPMAGTAFVDGMTITLIATDISGNSNNCSFNITITPMGEVDAGEDVTITQGERTTLNATTDEEGTYQWSPITGLDNPNIADPIAQPEETTTYTVLFSNNNNCTTSDEVTVFVEPVSVVDETKYGFSPDNDGINEYWVINGIEESPNNIVHIYNRWGNLVFKTRGYNNTTRVFNGEANTLRSIGANELPEGTYFFRISVDGDHKLSKLSGYLILKR